MNETLSVVDLKYIYIYENQETYNTDNKELISKKNITY